MIECTPVPQYGYSEYPKNNPKPKTESMNTNNNTPMNANNGQPNFWLVGSDWSNGDDMDRYDDFIRAGVWMLGWEDKEGGWPALCKKARQMKAGDGIAIVKWRGGADPSSLRVRAIGVVKHVISDDLHNIVLCGVDWTRKNIDRICPHNGARRAVEGPFTREGNPDWINTIFSL